MVERSVVIRNPHGIHCRPSALIIKAIAGHQGEIEVTTESGSTNLRSMIGLIGLGLAAGTVANVRVSGDDEEQLLETVVDLLEREYDFPDAGNEKEV